MYDFIDELPTEIVDWDPRILSLNTNGFTNSYRYILQRLSLTHDVTFVQETRFRNPTLQDRVEFHWNRLTNHEGFLFFEDPIAPLETSSPATGGLATLIHPNSPLRNAVAIPMDCPLLAGRYLQVQCNLGPATLVLHNLYAPVAPSERAAFFHALPRDFPPHYLHVASGDMNCILNQELDSLRPSLAVTSGSTELTTWLHVLGLVDIFRLQKPLRKTFTSPKLVNRLDYIFCSSVLARLPHWKASHLPHIPNADHVACQIITKRTTHKHGSGSWKCPPWLLRHPRAGNIIHGCLDRFLDKSPTFKNIGYAYDTMVRDIRHGLKELHTEQLEKKRAPLSNLAMEIAQLLQVPNLREDPVLVDRVRALQRQIHELHDQEKSFRQEQAFQLHLHKAERASGFHFSSPVPSPLRKTVFKTMETTDGTFVSDQQGMSDTLVDFYTTLFDRSEDPPSEDAMATFLTPLTRHKRLSATAQRELGAPLLANEFYHAIRHSSTNSSPGPSALPFEVLKLAPHKWSLVLELVFTYQLHRHPRLTPLQSISTLVLLHKKDKSANQLQRCESWM